MSLPERRDPFGRRYGSGGRSDVGYFKLDGSFANVRIVVNTEPPNRCIDHQLNFSVLDSVHNIRPALMHLENELGFDSLLAQEPVGPFGGLDLKSESGKLPGNFEGAPLSLSFTVIRTAPFAGSNCWAASSAL